MLLPRFRSCTDLRVSITLIVMLVSALNILRTKADSDVVPKRSCSDGFLQDMVSSLTFATGQGEEYIYKKFKEGDAIVGVCRLDQTCCSETGEDILRTEATRFFSKEVETLLTDTLMSCHNHSFIGSLSQYIEDNRANLVNAMSRTYNPYFAPYVTIFDEFYGYLQTAILTGDACQVDEKFTKVSFELFLAAYFLSPGVNPQAFPQTPQFRSCFYDIFLEERGDIIFAKLNALTRAFNVTLRYVRALRMVDKVIEDILALPFTSQCQNALMKLSFCSQCAGYEESVQPCYGLCMNSMRGCLIDLADMVEPISTLGQAMVRMVSYVNKHNLWQQMELLNSYFFTLVQETSADSEKIKENLLLNCDANGHRARRSAPLEQEEERQEKMVDSDQVQVHGRNKRLVTRARVPIPFVDLDASATCLSSKVSIFQTLAEYMCEIQNKNRSSDNCWTGATYGSYERNVVELNRTVQRDNPELIICSKRSRLREQVFLLQYMTRELDILTSTFTCGDDEDCVDKVPLTCNYYNFDDIEPSTLNIAGDSDISDTTPMVHSGSGFHSGSGSGSSEDEDDSTSAEEESACEDPTDMPTKMVDRNKPDKTPNGSDKDKTELKKNGSAVTRASVWLQLTLLMSASVLSLLV